MQKILIAIMLGLLLSGCSWVHKNDIEQGNILNREVTDKIHVGMSQAQVKELLGTPILMNTFSDNRIDYVYTFKPGGGVMTERFVTLTFVNGTLKQISGNMYSAYIR